MQQGLFQAPDANGGVEPLVYQVREPVRKADVELT